MLPCCGDESSSSSDYGGTHTEADPHVVAPTSEDARDSPLRNPTERRFRIRRKPPSRCAAQATLTRAHVEIQIEKHQGNIVLAE